MNNIIVLISFPLCIDTSPNTVAHMVTFPNPINEVAITPDGKFAYVSLRI
jgi:hypothetical protein